MILLRSHSVRYGRKVGSIEIPFNGVEKFSQLAMPFGAILIRNKVRLVLTSPKRSAALILVAFGVTCFAVDTSLAFGLVIARPPVVTKVVECTVKAWFIMLQKLRWRACKV
jgi:hypothetical protein